MDDKKPSEIDSCGLADWKVRVYHMQGQDVKMSCVKVGLKMLGQESNRVWDIE